MQRHIFRAVDIESSFADAPNLHRNTSDTLDLAMSRQDVHGGMMDAEPGTLRRFLRYLRPATLSIIKINSK